MTQIVKLGTRNQHGSFDQDSINYLAHETRLLSEIQQIDGRFTEIGQNYVFTVFLTHGLNVEFGFETEAEARRLRREYILAMTEFWGPDQIIFSNGVDHEVTVVAAVAGITEIFGKENRFGFSVFVGNAPYPVNLIFTDRDQAQEARKSICDKYEMYLQSRSNNEGAVLMAANG